MRRHNRRRVKRIALGVLATLVLALASAVIALHTSWGRELVRAQIERQLQATFTGGASLGRVEGSPLGTLTLRDLVIRAPDGRPAISVATLTVDLALLPLVSHQARVLGVLASGVEIDLARDARGELAVAHLLRPGPASAWSVELPRISVRDAHVRLDSGAEVMNFDGVTLDAHARLPHGGPLDAGVELAGAWRERAAAPLGLRAVVHGDASGLALPYLLVRGGDAWLLGHQLTVAWGAGGAIPAIGGSFAVEASAAAVARLAPGVVLPADLAVTFTATPVPGARWTALAVAGHVDHTPVRFAGTAELDARHLRGELSTGTLELGKLSSGRIAGSAAVTAVFDVAPGQPGELPVATATLRGWGVVAGVPRTAFALVLRSAGERAHVDLDATGDGARARLVASLRVHGAALSLEDATLSASASDPARASGGRAPVHGTLQVELAAHGALRPTPSLAVSGTVDGRDLRVQDIALGSLHVALDAQHLPGRPLGRAHVDLVDLARGELRLHAVTVDARDRADGTVAVAVRSEPTHGPWLIDGDALVTPPGRDGAVAIEVVRHRVRAGGGPEWTGHGGRVEVGPDRIVVTDLTSASASGRLALAGTYQRAGRGRGDLTAKVDGTALSLDVLEPAVRGKLDAHVAIARRAGRWEGDVQLAGTGLGLASSPRLVDGHAGAVLHGTQLALTGDAASPGLGAATLAVELDVPPVISDPAAWKRLARGAIRSGALTLHGIDLAQVAELAGLAGTYAGRLEGDLRLSATSVGGRVEARGVVVPALAGFDRGIDLVLELPQSTSAVLTPSLTASAAGLGTISARAELASPERVFDPAAWLALGAGVLRTASLRADAITVDPAMLDRFGITSELRGQVSVALDVGAAGGSLRGALDVVALHGDILVQPVDVHLTASSEAGAITSSIKITSAGVTLLDASGGMPVAIAQLVARWRVDPVQARAIPIRATARLASLDAVRLLAVFGRSEITAGAIDGTIELAGTLGAPTAKANLVATGLEVPPGPRGKPVRRVDRLALTGTWDGRTARFDFDGHESDGGLLRLNAVARPAALHDGTLAIHATRFDLIPILAFLPGPAGGAAGQLDADLTFTGLDLRTTQLAGTFHLTGGRVPIAPTVGTLRQATIDAVIADHQATLTIDGKLGRGTVAVKGTVALDGAAPGGGKAMITLRNVSSIGVVEPVVSADIAATLSHDHDQWRAELVVDHGVVTVSADRGERLKPAGAPADMTFVNGERLGRRPMERQAPSHPIFIVTIGLGSTRVESPEFRGLIHGKLEVHADGEAIGVFGGVDADRGDLDLFGRRYALERAGVSFDGSVDPMLDVRITHDFAEVTTITDVRGRLSAPELTMSSDPGTYSQGQLLGVLLGGDPGGDPQSSPSGGRIADAGTSLVAGKLSGYVRQILPINIDVLRYETASASNSSAVTVGTWLTHELFVAYRRHLETRPDENTGEGEVEYWLSRRIVLEGTAGDRGYDGVDLLWRLRY